MEVPRITRDELKRKMDAGEDLLILDVRAGSWYRSDRQIPGAIRAPKEQIASMYDSLPKGKDVVAYCT